MRVRSVLGPDYLAEKLALGIGAATLGGRQDDDVHDLYDWLREGVNHCADSGTVRGKHRTGFLLFEMTCAVVSRTKVITEVRTTLTETASDGTPLDADGRNQVLSVENPPEPRRAGHAFAASYSSRALRTAAIRCATHSERARTCSAASRPRSVRE
ncbi:hypothetical protein SAURM35S_02091 [Streptomyces aurantiogriseus]